MEPEETNDSPYTWHFAHGVDEKRRVQIPATWRPEGGAVEFTLVLWPKYREGACVRVLPPKQMAKLRMQIEGLAPDKKGLLKQFIIGPGSFKTVLDKAGRIILPEQMAQEAGIKDQAILLGMVDWFEIWEPERYNKIHAAHKTAASDALNLVE